MRIGIDTFSYDSPGQNAGVGPGVYVWSLLPELILAGERHEFVVFANKETQNMVPRHPNVTRVVCPGPNRIRPYRIVHEQCYLPVQFLKLHLDMLHFTGNNIAYILGRRAILTVFDLMWAFYLERGDGEPKDRYLGLSVPISLRKSRALITISRFVAEQVNSKFRNDSATVYPIHLAPGILPEPTEDDDLLFKEKYRFPFIFSVTTSMPHKNLRILLEAFLRLKRDSLFEGKLVVAGQLRGTSVETTNQFIYSNHLEEDILLTGFIQDQEKTFCYRGASAFVYPSLYEGFGLPILEAMQCGAPVIASNAASLPEVGGDACLYFNPNSVVELVDTIVTLLNDSEKRLMCINKGFNQIKKFSWEQTAHQTLAVYERIFQYSGDASIRPDGILK